MSEDQDELRVEDMLEGSDAGPDLRDIDSGALGYLVDALDALKGAAMLTTNGLASDHCENAAREIRKAMRMIGA